MVFSTYIKHHGGYSDPLTGAVGFQEPLECGACEPRIPGDPVVLFTSSISLGARPMASAYIFHNHRTESRYKLVNLEAM